MQKDSPTSSSDADYVIAELGRLGYIAKSFVFDCEDFGSPCARLRLYFLAWYTEGEGVIDPASAGYQKALKELDF